MSSPRSLRARDSSKKTSFATRSPPLPSPFLFLKHNPNPNILCPSLLVITISAPSISLLHRIAHKTLIGMLILPEISLSSNSLAPSPRDRSCYIYAFDRPAPSPPAVLISVQYPSRRLSLSISLLHRIAHKTLIGTLILPEISLSSNSLAPSPRDHSCYIYAFDRPAPSLPAVLISVQYPVTVERSRAVAKSFLGEIRAETFLILDSIRSQHYRERLAMDEVLTFKLETSEQRHGGDPTLVQGFEHLPLGSVIDGLGAAIIGKCQMRRAKGTLLATWPDNGRLPMAPLLRSLLQDLGFEVGGAEGEEYFAGFGFLLITIRICIPKR